MVFLGHCVAFAGSALGCLPSDPVDTPHLQVVAVRADPPTGTPARPVTLTLLDSPQIQATEAGVERAWLGGCHNPPSGEYYGCYPQLRQRVQNYRTPVRDTPDAELDLHPGELGLGKTFSFTVPGDIVSARNTTGMSFAFFAVCRGTLVPDPGITNSVPLACLDAQSQRLGRADFEVGFTTVPTVPGLSNQNPVLQGLVVDGVSIPPVSTEPSCQIDADCPSLGDGTLGVRCVGVDPAAPSSGRCAPLLERCDGSSCVHHLFSPRVDPASAEPNPLAADPGQPVPPEILTLELRGPWFELSSDFTRRSDQWSATLDFPLGIPTRYDGEGFSMWVVLRDNRGGVSWEHWEFALEP